MARDWRGVIVLAVCVAGCSWPEGWTFGNKPPAKAQTSRGSQATPLAASGTNDPNDPVGNRVRDYVDGFSEEEPPAKTGAAGGAARRKDEAAFEESPPASSERHTAHVRPQHGREVDDPPGEAPSRSVSSRTPSQDRTTLQPGDGQVGRPQSAERSAKQNPGLVRISGDSGEPEAVRPAGARARARPPTPPRLLSVRAAPARHVPTPAVEDDRKIVANQAVESKSSAGLQERFEELEQVVAENPNDLDSQMRLRMLYLADGRDAKALAPTPGMMREHQEAVLAAVRAMLAARANPGRDPALWANDQLSRIEEWRGLVRQQADLRIPRIAICQEVQSYGVFTEFSPAEFAAGIDTPVLVYLEAANFKSEKQASGEYRTRLSARLAILDRTGGEVWTNLENSIDDVSRNQRQDFFVPLEVTIPGTLNPGQYTMKATVTDLVAGKSNESKTTFRLVTGVSKR